MAKWNVMSKVELRNRKKTMTNGFHCRFRCVFASASDSNANVLFVNFYREKARSASIIDSFTSFWIRLLSFSLDDSIRRTNCFWTHTFHVLRQSNAMRFASMKNSKTKMKRKSIDSKWSWPKKKHTNNSHGGKTSFKLTGKRSMTMKLNKNKLISPILLPASSECSLKRFEWSERSVTQRLKSHSLFSFFGFVFFDWQIYSAIWIEHNGQATVTIQNAIRKCKNERRCATNSRRQWQA